LASYQYFFIFLGTVDFYGILELSNLSETILLADKIVTLEEGKEDAALSLRSEIRVCLRISITIIKVLELIVDPLS
jgi:hypothetical protein